MKRFLILPLLMSMRCVNAFPQGNLTEVQPEKKWAELRLLELGRQVSLAGKAADTESEDPGGLGHAAH